MIRHICMFTLQEEGKAEKITAFMEKAESLKEITQIKHTYYHCIWCNLLYDTALYGVFRMYGYYYRKWRDFWSYFAGKFPSAICGERCV